MNDVRVTLGVDGAHSALQTQAIFIGHNLGCHLQELGPRVGVWGIEMLMSLPIFDVNDALGLILLEDGDFTGEVLWRAVKDNPLLSPRTTPPEPWTQVRAGGLPPDHWAAGGSLVRGHRRSSEDAMRKWIGTGKMQPALDAVNVLQPVRFAINRPILNFIKQQRLPHIGTEPPKWKRQLYREWLRTKAKIQSLNLAIATAELQAEEPYFCNSSLTLDFRGRLYPSQHFNFAREDYIRALFLFADAKPIGEDGIRSLKARVAALADDNKFSRIRKPSDLEFDKRVEWTEANLEYIRAVAEAVERGDSPESVDYALPDERYQFAAACVELVKALAGGPEYPSRLPLMFDGSCNGLQHMCAMTRDEVGGRIVNLVPGHDPDDFYKRVAYQTYLSVEPDIQQGLMEGNALNRSLVKQPALSYFYGSGVGGFVRNKRNGKPYGPARPVGMFGQIIDYLRKTKKLKGEKPFKGTLKLARAVYESIEEMLPKARAARDFLQELARICARHGKPLRWVTPLGLPVINEYHPPEVITISAWLGQNRRRRMDFTIGDKPGIDEDKAADAAAANFVHSIDAAHLQLVALAAAKEGICLVVVHDCFGTHASHAERLREIILEQFVYLHKRHNLLNDVRESVRRDLPKGVVLPPLPELGTLDIDAVVKCTNAFK